jgi:lysozyme
MLRWDELENDELLFWGVVLIGGYFALNYFRDSMATAGAGFPAAAPKQPGLDSALDIISPMQVSPAGIAAIQQREGFSPKAARDGSHMQIGYGHDIVSGDGFNASSTINQAQGYDLLVADLADTAATLNNALTRPVTQNQFDALASFTYNVGAGAFDKSTLLQKVNQGDYAGASQEFARWDQAGGRRDPGLANRRQGEQNQFNA